MASLWDLIRENGIVDGAMPGGKYIPEAPEVDLSKRRRVDPGMYPLSPRAFEVGSSLASAPTATPPAAAPALAPGPTVPYNVGVGPSLPYGFWDLMSGVYSRLTAPPEGAASPSPRPEDGSLPPTAPLPPDRPMPGGPMPPASAQPAGAPPVDPQTQMIEEIKRQREALAELYGERPAPDFSKIDAEASAQKDRTKYLAQLAFFSGLAGAGGGNWKSVAAGLSNAGQVYDQGYERYINTLNSAAERNAKVEGQKYEDNSAVTSAAVDLVSKTRQSAIQNESARVKDRMKFIDDYFSKMLDANSSDYGSDPAVVEDIMFRWRKSRDRGDIIDSVEDVRD